ncbi:mechanosensitive ion channel family protein [bacterium]|nr:MAG: mechanosensitive ion channel family protein [bacterium]
MVLRWSRERLGVGEELLTDILVTLALWGAVLIARLIVHKMIDRRVQDLQRRYIANKTLNYVLGFVFTLSTMVVWFGGLTGWTAYLGLVSAGLAIALQDPLVNLAGWVFISVRKPFVVGDRIQIGDNRGDVIDQRLFQFSVVEIGNWVDADQSTGRIIHLPNGWIFKHALANYTAGFRFIWEEIAVMVTFESDWQRAKHILEDILGRHTAIKNDVAAEEVRQASRKYMIFFQHLTPIVWTSVADSGVVLTMRYICEPRKRRSTTTDIWEEILLAFATEDTVDFAYPTTRFYANASEGKPGAGGPPRN